MAGDLTDAEVALTICRVVHPELMPLRSTTGEACERCQRAAEALGLND